MILALLLNTADQTIKAFIVLKTEQRVQSYLGRLFVSPAVGGLAALAAAGITAWVVLAQLRHTKRKDAEANWWERYEWITERAFPSKAETNNPISEEFALGLLRQLESEAEKHLQKKACSSFISLVVQKENPSQDSVTVPADNEDVSDRSDAADAAMIPEEPSDPPKASTDTSAATPGPSDSSKPKGKTTGKTQSWSTTVSLDRDASDRLRRALSQRAFETTREYVESTQGTASSSPEAEVYVLRRQIMQALQGTGKQWKHVPNLHQDQIAVKSDGEVMNVIALPRNFEAARDRVSMLAASKEPVLAIAAKSDARRPGSRTRRVCVEVWDPSTGSEGLLKIMDKFHEHLVKYGLNQSVEQWSIKTAML